MTPCERLTDIFDRGNRDCGESLAPDERELFLIQDFIIEYEMGGLTTYLYSRLPKYDTMLATVAAMRKYNLSELAALLGEAAQLFRGYREDNSLPTWKAVLQHYDPENRIASIHRRIASLNDFGLAESSIS